MTTNRRFFSNHPPAHELREGWLNQRLADMDIPDMRRDITKLDNVRWLLRNIRVRNGNNEQCIEVEAVLHRQRKHLQKGA